jgi:hypothetical protein
MEHISWIGVGLAGLTVFIIGALWYGLIFGKLYRRELGVPDKPAEGDKGPNAMFFVWQLLAGILLVIPLSWFLAGTTAGEATLVEGAVAGFAAAVIVSAAQWQLFQAEGKSWKILLLHIGYFIVALKLAGVVLSFFQ